jgi:hypothetical protein
VRPSAASSLAPLHELGGGVAWFAQSMKFRVQADYFHLYGHDFGEATEQVRLSARLGL